MTTAQINLRDELAQTAASAGLLSAEAMEAMEAMLREQLSRRACEAMQSMWQRGPQEELTPEIEQEIVQEVRKVRAERRLRGASSWRSQCTSRCGWCSTRHWWRSTPRSSAWWRRPACRASSPTMPMTITSSQRL